MTLSGCATSPPDLITAIRNVSNDIPESVFDGCPDLPVVPDPENAETTQGAFARFAVESYMGMKACKAVVDSIRGYQDRVSDENDDGSGRDETDEDRRSIFPFFGN